MALELVQTQFSAKSRGNPPRKRRNAESRSREYLTPDEVDALMSAAKRTGRNGFRDALMIELAYRHGLRASELVGLSWDQVTFGRSCTLYVARRKRGVSGTHYLAESEIRALRRLQRQQAASRFVFASHNGTPLSCRTFHNIIQRAGRVAGFNFTTHPHMLRHGRGYALVNRPGVSLRDIQGYLGHASIASTTVYVPLAVERTKGFER
jgi:integrase